jgi:hypothetical protein
VIYDQAMNITGSNFDSLQSVVTVGGGVALGFVYQNNPGNGVETLHNATYKPAAGLDNPANIVVTVKGESSNVWSYLFSPQISGFSSDTVVAGGSVIINGNLFGTRTAPSSVRAYYLDAGFNMIYMSPNPIIVSWTTRSIKVTLPAYSSYPSGRPLLHFSINLEVDVSTKNNSQQVLYYE